MKQKKAYRSTLKWGLLLGIGLSIFELVKMCARKVEYGSTQLLDIALIIGFILILYAGIKEFKSHYTERLTFAKAFLGCIIISVIGSAIFFCYDMIHYQFVEPNGLNQKYEIALNNFRKVIDKDTITTEELTSYLDTVSKTITTVENTYEWPDSIQDETKNEAHKGIRMIADFHKNKIIEKKSLDTANNYVLANFQVYSRKTLIETLASYIDQNEQKASTPAVKKIIENANIQLEQISPADMRFEKNKTHVPHYDKPGRYAAISAMMDLLYGMFFGLFIAMYHYTSKLTYAQSMTGNPEDEIPEEEVSEKNDSYVNEEETKNN